jgi:hypothetical protein
MGLSLTSSQKSPSGARARLPWAPRSRATRIAVASSPHADYFLDLSVLTWAADESLIWLAARRLPKQASFARLAAPRIEFPCTDIEAARPHVEMIFGRLVSDLRRLAEAES